MKKIQSFLFVCISIAFLQLLVRCTADENQVPLMELLPPGRTGIDFSNDLYEDENLNIITFEYFYNGAGVGIIDINNDGLNDIFFSANMKSNRLYLNKGNFQFEDITEKTGLKFSRKWATGVSIVDINQDNFMDVYVCYAGPSATPGQRANELYINNGDNTFSEKAKDYGLADTGHSVQAAFFDYDRDGDLDMYLLTNTTDQTGPNVIRPKRVNGEMINTDRLYRNNGNHTFTNISAEAGVTMEGYGLGVSICDINSDGWPDIYISNDYLSNDILYINNKNGTFSDKAAHYFKHTSYSAMGNDVSDFNNDGLLDLIEVDMLPPDNKRQKMMFGSTNYDRYRSEMQYGYAPQFMRNALQLNDGIDATGKPLFSEIAQLAGVEATDWSWSPLFADIDNDGWKDLLITNGYARDITNRDFVSYRMHEFMQEGYSQSSKKKLLKAINSIEGAHIPIFAFKNRGDLTFSNTSSLWGFTTPSYSTGAAYADLDNDGDLDYVTNNINGPAFVFQNHSENYTQNHFLKIKLTGPSGNIQGYGAKIWLYLSGDTIQYTENFPYRGYQSSMDQEVHFGLGKTKVVDSIMIHWPDEKLQLLKRVNSDQTLSVKHSEAKKIEASESKTSHSLFIRADQNRGILFRHLETEYADFKIQPLLPHKYSENGPGIAVGDVNGDDLEDFFIGGAFKQSGQLFIQKSNGKFSSSPLVNQTKYEEDMGALLFDADGDNDNDLYVVSGGNEFASGSPYYQDRLYVNDGKGNFKEDPKALPVLTASSSCVIAADYDKDNDLDLFVGGRVTPQHYPQSGQSYILRNDHGRFTDVTEQVAPGLNRVGMVTSGLWTDTDNDNQLDLILVGEWMPVTIFKNNHGKFQSTAIIHSMGWWNCIQAADFDEDGDTDYVLGNLGLNTKYKTSIENPVSLYVDDFNHDGVQDAILSHYIQGVNRPAHPRDDLFQQMPQLKKKYQSYKAYSETTMETLINGTETKPAILKTETFQTSYLENKGKQGWQLTPLPQQAQFAPVFGIVAGDYNNDGYTDIVLSGNSYSTDVLTGRYDALKGLLLKGDGAGHFKPLSTEQSGILIDGDAKSLAELTDNKGHTLLLAAQNNDTLKVFERFNSFHKDMQVTNQDVYSIVTLANGKKSKYEFYFGNGYLSQSSRRLKIPGDAKQVVIYNGRGKGRTVNF